MSGPNPSPLLIRLVELLGDGEWADFETTIQEVGKLVPPGLAMRRAERRRVQNSKRSGSSSTERVRPLSAEAQIATGRRIVVRDVVRETLIESDARGEPGPRPPGQPRPRRRVRLRRLPPRVAHALDDGRWQRSFDAHAFASRLLAADDDETRRLLGLLAGIELRELSVELCSRVRALPPF